MNSGWQWLAGLPLWAKIGIGFAGFAALSTVMPRPERAPAPPPVAAQPAPRHLADMVDDVDQVSLEGRTLKLRAKLGENAFGEDWMLSGAARTVEDVGKALRSSAEAGHADTVEIQFWTDGVDRLGAVTVLPLFDIRFSAADLKQARFENLGFGPTLNLASGVQARSAAGTMIIAAWCAKPDNARSGTAFCLLALR